MTVAELSVRKPITIVMVYILICVISCVFIPKLGIALYPKTTMPVLSVFANYPGVGPEEVDKNVTQLIVDRVKGVQGIKNITSKKVKGLPSPTEDEVEEKEVEVKNENSEDKKEEE